MTRCLMTATLLLISCGSHSDKPKLPTGPFVSISLFSSHDCGIRPDGSLECWGGDPIPPPPGRYKQVATQAVPNIEEDCALRDDNTLVCWNRLGVLEPKFGVEQRDSNGCDPEEHFSFGKCITTETPEHPPKGTFVSLVWRCALTADHQAVCWGPDGSPERGVRQGLPGSLAAIFLDRVGYSAVTFPAHEVANLSGSTQAPPAGAFNVIVSQLGTTTTTDGTKNFEGCGIHEDGSVQCWVCTAQACTPVTSPHQPPGRFTMVKMTEPVVCALHEDGRVLCWNMEHLADGPKGTFTFLETQQGEGSRFCGIHTNGELECWDWLRSGEGNLIPSW